MLLQKLACIVVLSIACVAVSGCRKKVATTPPAPPAPPAVAESPIEPAAEPSAPDPVRAATEKPQPAPAPLAERSFAEEVERLLRDAYFDYDRFTLRDDGRETLLQNAEHLKSLFEKFPSVAVLLEGHADERGSAEYNLGLADRRAATAREFLTTIGIPPDRLKTVSYGEERQQCLDENEECWQRNRRVHASPAQSKD